MPTDRIPMWLTAGLCFVVAAGCIPFDKGPRDPADGITPEQLVAVVTVAVEGHERRMHAPPDTVPPDTVIVDPDDPPPPIKDTGLISGVPLAGWWDGWLARGNGGMGSKFFSYSGLETTLEAEDGPDQPETAGSRAAGFGEMANNTNAALKLPGPGKPGEPAGWFEIEFSVVGQNFFPGGGGQHVLGLVSQAAPQAGPADPALPHLDGWYRLDFGLRENGVQPTIYQDGEPRTFNPVGQIRGEYLNGKWMKLRVEWKTEGRTVRWAINNGRVTEEFSSAIANPNANPVGNLLFVGNCDTNRGERCRGGVDPCGLIGRVRYRNLRWGR